MSERFGSAILLNPQHVRWRRSFDLAHELFHVMIWSVFRGTESERVAPKVDKEKLATCFARNLPMPRDALNASLARAMSGGKVSIEALFAVARQFDVSIEALIWQLTFVRRLEEAGARDLIARCLAAQGLWERRLSTAPPDRPSRFVALAVRALRRGEISAGRCSEYLGISRREALALVSEAAPGKEEIELGPS